jgi:acetyltransferase-like isoleucine patch superfamily enzyme
MSYFKIFIQEYITNFFVSNFPSIKFRNWFYRQVVKIRMDDTVNIQMGCYVYVSGNYLEIGKNTVINRCCTLDRRGGLRIGSCVNISPGVCIFTAGHSIQSLSFSDFKKPVIIKDHVWIGSRAMIMPGVTIEVGAVVLPGAVVTRDVEAYAVVGGVPAQVIASRKKGLDYSPAWYPPFQ